MSAGRPVSPPRRRRSPYWLKPALLLVGGLIVVFGAISAIAVLHALRLEHRINGLTDIVDGAEKAAENGRLGEAEAALASAQKTLTSINSTLYNSPDFSVVHVLPVARQNLDAIRRSVSLGLQLVAGGQEILRAGAPLENPQGHLDVGLDGGRVPLATTEAVDAAINQVVTSLPATSAPPSSSFLVGRVRGLEQRLYLEAYHRRQQLEAVGSGIQLLDDIAGGSGPRRFLIAVGNSAEMRGSGGMILSYGVLTSADGKIKLDHFGPIDELSLTKPETKASFPTDFEQSYGYLQPTLAWRNANIMSDFSVDAPVLEAMYTQATGLPVNGVIQIDPEGLAAILAGIGPVPTPDLGVVTSANVVPITLSQAYFAFQNRAQRQDYTGEAAQATFAKLTTGRFSTLRPLGTSIVAAGVAHHVLMYANDTADEDLLIGLGFDGALPPSFAPFTQLTVQNFGNNKLDYYLHSSVTITGHLATFNSAITATITITNGAPPGQTTPVEVFGSSYPGLYRGLVTLYLPAHAYLGGTALDPSVTTDPVAGSQNGVATFTFSVAIPPGGSSRVALRIVLPVLPPNSTTLYPIAVPRVITTTYTQHYT